MQARRGHEHASESEARSGVDWSGYGRLLAMVGVSTIVMYVFMYWNIYRLEDFRLSETRAFMSVLMGGTMLAIMLAFMLPMYKTRWLNVTLFVLGGLLFLIGLYFVRSQTTVQDTSWMKSMIPHHSIAIMVSERAEISDPRARKLADEIIAAQEKEIAEMNYLIAAIENEGEADEGEVPLGHADGPPRIATLEEALAAPAIASLDVGGMTPEEIALAVENPMCTFRFSEGQKALVAAGVDGRGVMKISGQLVPLTSEGTEIASGQPLTLGAEGATFSIRPLDGDDMAADLVMALATEPALRVGYRGVYLCGAANVGAVQAASR